MVITPDKQQIVERLFSTYEELCHLNARPDEYSRSLEAEVQARTQQLREAEAKYRMLVEQLPAVTYIAAPGAVEHMLYVSPQIEQLRGFSVDEWLAEICDRAVTMTPLLGPPPLTSPGSFSLLLGPA